MTKKIKIWDREFNISIKFDCYEDEKITEKQKLALSNFLEHIEWIDKSKKKVEKYCSESVKADINNKKKDNIFSYVMPEYIYINRDNKNPKVCIICNYKYDLENGIAIVFSLKGNIKIGNQSILG